jgi:hypothetical protein
MSTGDGHVLARLGPAAGAHCPPHPAVKIWLSDWFSIKGARCRKRRSRSCFLPRRARARRRSIRKQRSVQSVLCGMKVVLVLSAEAILIGALIGVVLGCPLCRRSRFWLRFAGVVIAIVLPALLSLVAILATLGEQTAGMLFWLGLAWGILLLAPSRFVLFHGRGLGSGPDDEDGEGPGPGDGSPTPPGPIGGIPLPDAEPSLTRVRDHRPTRRAPRPRRPTRQRERVPSRLWPSRLWPSWRPS